MRSGWSKLLVAIGLLVVILFGLWLYFDTKYQHMIDVELARIRAEGWPVTTAECAPEPVPDAQNAAVLYQQVFQIDFADPYASPRPTLVFDHRDDIWITYRTGLSPEDEKRIQQTLSQPENKRILEILRQASERPYCVFPIDWASEQPPTYHYGLFKDAARLVALLSFISAHKGNAAEALDWCRVGLRMSEHFAAEPTLVAQLVSIAMNSIIIREAEGFLDTAAVSPQNAESMEGHLHDIDMYAPFTGALVTERVRNLSQFDIFRNSPTICYNVFRLRGLPEWFREMVPSPAPLTRAGARLYCSRVGWPVQKLDQLRYLAMMDKQVELSKYPYYRVEAQYKGQQRAVENMAITFGPVTKVTMPTYLRAVAKRDYGIAEIGLFRVVLALKAYKYERRAYPESLAQLQQTLSWQLPLDPFSSNSFVYRCKGKGFKLYSLWSDLDDDGGEPIEKHRYEDGDIVWECHR